MLKTEVESGFKPWLRDTLKKKGLRPYEVAWMFPWQLDPKTVESWVYGKNRPRYAELVGLCAALGELPPALAAICRDADAGT